MPKISYSIIRIKTNYTKLVDFRATLNTRAKVSIINLLVTKETNILITLSNIINLKTITRSRLKFISYIDNIRVIISDVYI